MVSATDTGAPARLQSLREGRSRVILVVIGLILAVCAAWQVTAMAQRGSRTVAMSAECHQAYRGYMEASDPAEADFWAESWMTFGCESGGYWA
jgi:hypothetical protein